MSHPLLSRFNGFAAGASPLAHLLLGLQRDSGTPVMFGPHRLERVRIVIIDRDPAGLNGEDEGDDDGTDETDENDQEAEVLPPLHSQRLLAPPRLVRGEILRGEDGALYERFGNRIRTLRGLASGPRGEVLEIAAAPLLPPPAGGNEKESREPAFARQGPGPVRGATADANAKSAPAEPPAGPAFRPLFPEPGHARIVRLADTRALLAPQLEHPERLRDSHRLSCRVQMFEIARPLSLTDLAAAVTGDTSRAPEFARETLQLVQIFGLGGLLTAPRAIAQPPQSDPNLIVAGERVLHVVLAHDPTAPVMLPQAVPGASTIAPTAASVGALTPTATGSRPAVSVAKTAIPDVFLRAVPFLRSRDEALMEQSRPEGLMARMRRAWQGTSDELRHWQVRLSGRTIEEQLWAVPPPQGWRRDRAVQGWAEQTLALGGYALPAMLHEWKLFWIRRGC